MKLAIFGSLASSAPVPGRNHLAFALEKDEGLYWFEAGENCSRTASFMGYAPEKVRQLFISNFHTVNCGGLSGLLQYLSASGGGELPLFLPVCGALSSFYALAAESSSSCRQIQEHSLQEKAGTELDGVRVTWAPAPDLQGPWSFKIEAEGKKIVYSTFAGLNGEAGSWLRNADVLLLGTAEASPPEFCRRLKREKHKIGKLIFFHGSPGENAAYEEMCSRTRDSWNGELFFAEDGWIFDI